MGTPIPANRARLRPDEVRQRVGGRWIGSVAPLRDATVGISTDSRTVRPGELFVAISGAAHDGHRFVGQAARAGAAMAIVEREIGEACSIPLLRVSSSLDALGALARAVLRRWRLGGEDRRVIALTGSAGKTTSRSVISALLRQALPPGQVHGTRGNLNNLVGVPMIALGIEPEHRIAVFELGTNAPGEIAALGALVEPDVALLTLIAVAHTEGLGDIERIAAEKGSLFRALSPTGVAIGNGDDPRVVAALTACKTPRRIRYGFADGVEVQVVTRRVTPSGRAEVHLRRAAGEGLTVELPLLGEAGALALAAAVATVEATLDAPLTPAQVAAAMAELDGASEQGRLRTRGRDDGLLVVDDSYNANPASCRASLRTARELADLQGRALVTVLGEMRELGTAGPAEHESLGQFVATVAPRLLIAVGGLAEHTARVAASLGVESRFVPDAVAAAREAVAAVTPADLVLVKGSRGVGTERVVQDLLLAPVARSTAEGAA